MRCGAQLQTRILFGDFTALVVDARVQVSASCRAPQGPIRRKKYYMPAGRLFRRNVNIFRC